MKKKTTSRPHHARPQLGLALALLAATSACGGGGGAGDAVLHSTNLGALTNTGQLSAIDSGDASMELCTSLQVAGLVDVNALTRDSVRNAFYMHDRGREVLVRIEPDNTLTLIGHDDLPPEALDHDALRDRLWGVRTFNSTRSELSWINPATGQATIVGLCALVQCLAYDESTDLLYGIGRSGNMGVLYSIDPATGASQDLSTSFELTTLTGLALDSLTRTLYAIRSSSGELVEIDLSTYAVTDLATFDASSPIHDIAFDTDTGRFYGLTQGGELAQLSGTWPAGELERQNVLERRIGSMTFDPVDGQYFAVDALQKELVKLDAETGSFRTIGSFGDSDIESLVYDPALGTLYGIQLRDGTTDLFVEIDTLDATLTPVSGVEFFYPAQLAIDPTTGTIHGYERERNVAIVIQPNAPSPDDRFLIVTTSHFVTSAGQSYIFEDLTFDPTTGLLYGVGTQRVDEGGGSTAFYDVIVSFHPTLRNQERIKLIDLVFGSAISRNGSTGLFHVALPNQPLVELEFRATGSNILETLRTRNGLWNLPYVSAVRDEASDVVYAVQGRQVYSIDPLDGDTTWIDGQPLSISADDVLYDATRDYLGLRDGANLYWVDPLNPASALETVPVPAYRVITSDPSDPSILYGASNGVLYRYDVPSMSTTQLTSSPLPDIDEDSATFGPGTNTIHIATEDRRLFRVDVKNGQWTEVGTLEFGTRAIYAD